jgi:predicted NAD/FAD-binding protein
MTLSLSSIRPDLATGVGTVAPSALRRIGVVGSGIAGLAAAARLAALPGTRVTLFETGQHFGGHAHTVDVELPDPQGRPLRHGVDTGFLVFNRRTYPRLLELFEALQVPVAASDMSFSVQAEGLEWCGSNLATVFAQKRNLLRPRFWGMLGQILRFNRLATELSLAMEREGQALAAADESVGDFLDLHTFDTTFRRWYLLPMVACIWSCPTEQMLAFPMATLARFCHNHGLLQVVDRPQWYTVAGGSQAYVQRLLTRIPDARLACPVHRLQREVTASGQPRVWLDHGHGREAFDAVVLACHSDQALALLGEGASATERALLGAIGYQPNEAVLHTDLSLLPQRRAAWAAWNYETGAAPPPSASADVNAVADAVANAASPDRVCLHYLINRLQPLPFHQQLIVSLNPIRAPRPETVISRHAYAHPVFDRAAIQAQGRLGELQGEGGVWFCGAWTGYGFHEDGLRSGMETAAHLARRLGLAEPAAGWAPTTLTTSSLPPAPGAQAPAWQPPAAEAANESINDAADTAATPSPAAGARVA